jgi:hypothetical protein
MSAFGYAYAPRAGERLVFPKHLALKSGGGLNLPLGLVDPRVPSFRRHERAECIVRRIPHLLVGLERPLPPLAQPSDGAHSVFPFAFRSLYHVPLSMVVCFHGVFKCVAQSLYIHRSVCSRNIE